jgi:transcriptional regulator
MTLYVPSHFRVDDPAALQAFIERHAFGTLVTSGAAGLHVSHIPFVCERDPAGGLRLLGHVARANPQSDAVASAEHLVAIFQGPHAYVSPSWYAHHPAVPTWNYAVVHAHGRATPLDESGLRALLETLSARYEKGRPNAWSLANAPAEFIDKLVRTIAGFAIDVERIEGKFKLSQNRPADDAERVVAALDAGGEGELAALMRDHLSAPRGKIRS